jgi:hypothetical protein
MLATRRITIVHGRIASLGVADGGANQAVLADGSVLRCGFA